MSIEMLRSGTIVSILTGALSFAVPVSADEEPQKPPIKRIRAATEDELRKQLLSVPNVGLDQASTALMYAPLRPGSTPLSRPGRLPAARPGRVPAATPAALPFDYGPRFLLQLAQKHGVLNSVQSLPWRSNPDCQVGKEAAERLDVLSVNLRAALQASASSSDRRPDAETLKGFLEGGKTPRVPRAIGAGARKSGQLTPSEWKRPEAIPTLLQLLQTENVPIRLVLIELLAAIKGKEATTTLAQRAIFDLSPQVRERAIEELAKRPADEYREVVLNGLRWPWPAVAEHAAEAIAALKTKELIAPMIELLKEADPRLPSRETGKSTRYVTELVTLNHLANCMVCHAPSTSKEDLVRGRMPVPGEDPPPLYYQERTGLFIRADVTFLRQDFSVVQPVLNSGKWPGSQRFDYLLRKRPATRKELALAKSLESEGKLSDTFPQKEALLFALRQLTSRDLGSRYESWRPLLRSIEKQP